jgi:hypothetical protein
MITIVPKENYPERGDFVFDLSGEFSFCVEGYNGGDADKITYHVPEEEIGEFLLEHIDQAGQITRDNYFQNYHPSWQSVTSKNVLHLLQYAGVL